MYNLNELYERLIAMHSVVENSENYKKKIAMIEAKIIAIQVLARECLSDINKIMESESD